MLSSLNRAAAYLNTKVPYVVKKEEHALEEKNTIIVPHKRRPFGKRIKKMYRNFRKNK